MCVLLLHGGSGGSGGGGGGSIRYRTGRHKSRGRVIAVAVETGRKTVIRCRVTTASGVMACSSRIIVVVVGIGIGIIIIAVMLLRHAMLRSGCGDSQSCSSG